MSYDQFGVTTPFGGSVTVTNNVSFANPWGSLPGGTSPFPGPVRGTTASLFPHQWKQPIATLRTRSHTNSLQQFNLSVQRQFGADWLVTASYVGNVTRHLWIDQQINPAVYAFLRHLRRSAGQYGLTAPGPCSTTANTLNRRVLSLLNPNQTPASNAPFNTQPYFQNVDLVYPYGNGSYNGLILTAAHRFARNFSSTTNCAVTCVPLHFRSLLAGARFWAIHDPQIPTIRAAIAVTAKVRMYAKSSASL